VVTLINRSTPPFPKLQSNSFGPEQLVFLFQASVDSGDVCVCAKLMETHQKPILNNYGVKQADGGGGRGGGIYEDSDKIQTRDNRLNGANSAEPLTTKSRAKFCTHLYRRRPLLGLLPIM